MKTNEDLQQELNVSAATIANWVKAGILPSHNTSAGYDEATYNALYNSLLVDHKKLQKRANRSQNKSQITAANPARNARARHAHTKAARLFAANNTDVNSFMLALSLACLQQKNLIQVKGSQISSANTSFTAFLQNWQNSCSINLEQILPKLALPENSDPALDFLGATYESLRTVSEKAGAGAYFTPGRLVSDLRVPANATLLDPCSGTGSLVLAIISKQHKPECITLYDTDELALKIARVNFVLFFNSVFAQVTTGVRNVLFPSGIVDPEIKSISANAKFDFIITNPPFGAALTLAEKIQISKLNPEIASTESFGVALVNSLKQLKKNGSLYFLLPESFLYVEAHQKLRALVFSMPGHKRLVHFGNAFRGVVSRIIRLELTKAGPADSVTIANGYVQWEAPLTLLQENGFRPPYVHHLQELDILKKVFAADCFYLAGKCRFGLGIVTGNNKQHLSTCAGNDGFEPVYTGKQLGYFGFSEPEYFVQPGSAGLQQMAPRWHYTQHKICYRFISDAIVTAADFEGRLLLNSINFFTPNPTLPLKALCAFLNAPVVTFLFRRLFNANKVLRKHLERIPVPAGFYQTAHALTQLHERAVAGETVAEELNAFVCALYGLTQAEASYIFEAVKSKSPQKKRLPKIEAA